MVMTPAILLFTPIFLPVATELGIDPIYIGIMELPNLCMPLFIAMAIALIMVTYIPSLSLWLPELFAF